MARVELNNESLENVTGGTIVFSPDNATCGLNCNNQAKVNDYAAAKKFITEHWQTMSEKDMLREMVKLGYITRL